MRIGGLQKNSFIDYPGKISCVIFLSGCNFRCPYCHNPELAKGGQDNLLPSSSVMNFIKTHKSFLDGVVISGGEPTLQSGFINLCEEIKEFKLPIKLDTNGSRSDVIREAINNKLIDHIAMDVKTSISIKYSSLFKNTNVAISDIATSIDVIMSSNVDYEFRTTCIKSLVNEGVMDDIGGTIKGTRRYFLQKPNLTNVLIPDFFNSRQEKLSDKEIIKLKTIAGKYVDSCTIR